MGARGQGRGDKTRVGATEQGKPGLLPAELTAQNAGRGNTKRRET